MQYRQNETRSPALLKWTSDVKRMCSRQQKGKNVLFITNGVARSFKRHKTHQF